MDFEFGGFDHPGFSDFESDLEEFEVKKARKFDRMKTVTYGGSISGGIRISEGIAYFGAMDQNVYAVDARNGEEIWRFRTNGVILDSTPVIANNVVYIGSYDGYFYAIDSKLGKEIWKFKTGDLISTEASYDNGIVYFGSLDGFIYALSGETGKEIWRFRTGKYGNASAPTLYEGALYYGCRDGIFYAIRAKDGKEIWRYKIEGKGVIDKRPLVYEGKVYFGGEDGNLYCLSLEGKELWRFKVGDAIFSSAAAWKGKIFTASWDCHLYALEASSGKELWRFATSTMVKAKISPPYEVFEVTVKKAKREEEGKEEEKYTFEFTGREEFESEYNVRSEYVFKSEYG
jgi:outer membrane protein assembly factor BamB